MNRCLLFEEGPVDAEELAVVEEASLGAGELGDAASHGVCGMGECAPGFEPQLAKLGGVDVRRTLDESRWIGSR